MYEYLIKEYVKKLTINDIHTFAKNNNIDISSSDADTLFYYAKNHYKELLEDDPTSILKEIKKKIDPITFDKAYKLYLLYRNQYLFK